MQSPTSRSSAPAVERPVLAPHWLTILLAGMLGGGLALLHGRHELERRLLQSPDDSALARAYLRDLLRTQPDNPQWRNLLVQRQVAAGEVGALQATLRTPVVEADPARQREARWVMWEAAYNQYWQASAATRPAMQPALLRQLHEMAGQTWSLARRQRLTQQAVLLGARDEAVHLMQGLAAAQSNPEQAAQIYAGAAREALANSQYALSAALYLDARKATADPRAAKAHYLAAVAAMQAGGQAAAALDLAERELGALDRDGEVLRKLVQLAREAGRPDVAERYMKRLLQLALMEQWWVSRQAVAEADAVPSFRPVVYTGAPQPAVTPSLPFDNETYTLGYKVFLENRNLEDAWLLAKVAVQRRPGDMAWRERFAQVSEWTKRPEVALENWLVLARQTQKASAWQAVLRLAPGLFDDAALVDALRYELRRRPGEARLLQELVAAYERLGDPHTALTVLRTQPRQPAVLRLQAELATRSGDLDLALQSWRALFQDPTQLTPELATRAATVALLKGEGAEGLRWLEAARAPAGTEADAGYLRMTAQVAEGQQRDARAIEAYRQLVARPDATVEDHDALIRALTAAHPLDAAAVAARAWDRFDQPRHLVQALTLYAGRSHWTEMRQLLEQVDFAPQAARHAGARLRQEPEFLRAAGSFYQGTGQLDLARRHYEAALHLAPQSTAVREALLWLLIDGADMGALQQVLGTYEQQWRREPAMHDALAAAYQALSQPQVALDRYLTPHLSAHQGDLLWLMNYADVLDQNQQADRAWRLRRHLLTQEWQGVRARQAGAGLSRAQARARWLSDEGLDEVRRIARARLWMTQRPGDVSRETLRELMRLDQDARQGYSNVVAETAIGWLQDASEYNAERGFLWHQYVRSRSTPAARPLWAEITVALADQDVAETGRLLETHDARLPRYDRIQAATMVGDIRLAQTAAFEAQEAQSSDDPLHEQLADSLLSFSDQAGVSWGSRHFDGLDESERSAQVSLGFSPRWSARLAWVDISRSATQPVTVFGPTSEHALVGALKWQGRSDSTELQVAQRESLATYHPVSLEHEHRIDARLSARLELGRQLPMQDSLVMRMAGMKDRVGLGLRYQFSRLDALALDLGQERYHLQTGAQIGDGRQTTLSYWHTYRQGGPGVDVGTFWSQYDYSHRTPLSLSGSDLGVLRYFPAGTTDLTAADLLPRSYRYYGIQLNLNTRFEQGYTRALRPYASVSLTRHSELGAGYGLHLGLARSVLGNDHLSLSWGLGKAGRETPGLSREIQLTYRYHF